MEHRRNTWWSRHAGGWAVAGIGPPPDVGSEVRPVSWSGVESVRVVVRVLRQDGVSWLAVVR